MRRLRCAQRAYRNSDHESYTAPDVLIFSSLSEENLNLRPDRWSDPDRGDDPPSFGWPCGPVRPYEPAPDRPLLVQDRERGMVPLFMVTQMDHPLAIDQRKGITRAQWHRMARSLLH
uniref:DUF2199 domain-containing protein n=1 Tax=Asticcacaulis sp. DW145 TaxID=3095608 RepID=UPI00403F0EBC